MRSVKSYSCYKEYCLVILFTLFTNFLVAGPAVKYTWQGTTSHEWGNSANWSPSGVPGTSDSVVINSNGSNSPELTSDRTVAVFTMTGGSLNYTTKTLTVTGTFSFTGGEMFNGGKLIVNSSGTATFGSGTNSIKSIITCNTLFLNGCTFGDSLTITKNGTSNDNSKGNNTFNKYVSITNTNRGSIVLSDSFPDTFEKIVSIYNKNKDGAIYVAHRGTGNRFKDNVIFYGVNIYSNYYGTVSYEGNITINCSNGSLFFGYSSGSATLASGKSMVIGDTAFAAGKLVLRHFTTLGTGTEVNLSLSGSATLTFDDASTYNGTVTGSAPGLELRGSRFLKTTNLTKTGSTSNTCYGGCYFGDTVTITMNNSSGVLSLSSTATDTFNVGAMIQNLNGTLSINNARFNSNVTLKNTNTSTSNDRFLVASSGAVTFNAVTTIDNSGSGFITGSAGGTTTVSSGGSLSLKSGFTGNITLKYLTQQGSTAHSFSFPSASSKLLLGPGTTFNGAFSFNGRSVVLNGTTFNSNATILRYGSVPDTCLGGNIFNGTTVIHDSLNSAPMLLAYTSADDFNGNVTFKQNGSGVVLYPSYNKNSTFAGDVSFAGTSAITVGQNGGKAIFDGTSTQNLYSTNGYSPTIKKVQINKSLGTKLKLNQSFSISDSLILSCGRIESDTVNFISMNNGSKLTGGSDSTFIQGPLKKIGNSTFKFPLGASSLGHPYHPLEITAPSSTTDAYTANYFATEQALGTVSDTSVDNLNECQYWKLNRDAGTSKVRVKLAWNHDSCEALSPMNMRVVAWNDSMWIDMGNSIYSGSSTYGTATSHDSVNVIKYFTLAFKKCIAITKSISYKNSRCYGSNDGSASIVITKGTPGYTYSWSSGMGASSSTPHLKPGKYYVSCMDKKGCAINDSVVISRPDSLSFEISTMPTTCGNANGSASLQASGGVGAIAFHWLSLNTTSSSVSDLYSGEYRFFVMDSNNCSKTGVARVLDTNGPGMNIVTQINPVCFGGDTGSVIVEGASADTPFVYRWFRNPDDTLPILTHLKAGQYPVEIISNSGCITYDTVNITQPDTFAVTISVTGTPCGSATGQMVATTRSPARPLTYIWSTSGNTDSIETGLNAGIVTVTVIDSSGCTLHQSGEINTTSGISLTSSVLSNITCFRDTFGSATVSPTGGTPPYKFYWNGRLGTDSAFDLVVGDYDVVVIDTNGCRAHTTLSITSPPQLEVYLTPHDASSDSSNDGAISTLVYGGVPPYSYYWSNGETGTEINNLMPYDYQLLVTDANDCHAFRACSINISHDLLTCYDCSESEIHSPCSISLPSGSVATKYIKADFGAIGDGVADDECAFEAAAKYFNSLPPNVPKVLYIESGTYYVGSQIGDYPNATNPSWYLWGRNPLCFHDINNLTIEGQGNPKPIIRFKGCMRYGAFDAPNNPESRFLGDYSTYYHQIDFTNYVPSTTLHLLTGSAFDLHVGDRVLNPGASGSLHWVTIPPNTFVTAIINSTTVEISNPPTVLNFPIAVYNPIFRFQSSCNVSGTDYSKIASVGDMFHFSKCGWITIDNLELDGNVQNAVIGGGAVDGIQQAYTGIFLASCNNVSLTNLDIHHFGWDGVYITNPSTCALNPHPNPYFTCLFNYCNVNYNCRNNVSWTGGQGLWMENSHFDYAGTSRFCSKPGAGLDIEWENNSEDNSSGDFRNCYFKFNKNCGVICDAASGTNPMTIHSFDFKFHVCTITGSEYGYNAWPNSKAFFFEDCNFYGILSSPYAAYFSNRVDALASIDHIVFQRCNFYDEVYDPVSNEICYFSNYPSETKWDGTNWVFDPLTTIPNAGNINPATGLSYPCGATPLSNRMHVLEFTQCASVQMTNCKVESNLGLRAVSFNNDNIGSNFSCNRLSNCDFENYGFSYFNCERDVASLNYLIANQNPLGQQWSIRTRAKLTGRFFPPYPFQATTSCSCNGGAPYFISDHHNFYSIGPILTPDPILSVFPGNIVYAGVMEQGLNDSYFPGLGQLRKRYTDPLDPDRVTEFYANPCTDVTPSFPLECSNIQRHSRTLIENESMEKFISVSPSITNKEIFLTLSEAGEVIQIYTGLGNQVMSFSVLNKTTTIDVSGLSPGVYFISSLKSGSCKFIKQ